MKKRIIGLLLILTMMFLLCACGNSLKKDIVGTWSFDYDIGKLMTANMGEEFVNCDAPLEISIEFEFTKDGKYKTRINKDKLENNFTTWLDKITDFSINLLYESYATEGLTKEEVNESVMDETGMTVEELFMTSLNKSLSVDTLIDTMFNSSLSNGTYKLKGNKLFMSLNGKYETYKICTIKDNTMELKFSNDASEEIMPGIISPLVLTRE